MFEQSETNLRIVRLLKDILNTHAFYHNWSDLTLDVYLKSFEQFKLLLKQFLIIVTIAIIYLSSHMFAMKLHNWAYPGIYKIPQCS